MYPVVDIDINKLKYNINKVKELCNRNNIELSLVTKVLSGNKNIVKEIIKCVDSISDSRVENLKEYNFFNGEKILIRVPSLSEIEEVIKYSTISVNSEIITIKALNEEAKRQNKIHKIILMYELGDLREGASLNELKSIINEVKNYSNINIYGIGANLSCYGGVVPSNDNMNELKSIHDILEKECGINIPVISGANSTSYKMLLNGMLNNKINHSRMGECIYLGNIPAYEEEIKELYNDVFVLKAQISELKEKESIPRGEILKDSFGNSPVFTDYGLSKRALINIGKQDISLNMKPLDKDITILGASSDYVILKVDDKYKVGDIIEFIPDYESLLKIMTSKYVRKNIIC